MTSIRSLLLALLTLSCFPFAYALEPQFLPFPAKVAAVLADSRFGGEIERAKAALPPGTRLEISGASVLDDQDGTGNATVSIGLVSVDGMARKAPLGDVVAAVLLGPGGAFGASSVFFKPAAQPPTRP